MSMNVVVDGDMIGHGVIVTIVLSYNAHLWL